MANKPINLLLSVDDARELRDILRALAFDAERKMKEDTSCSTYPEQDVQSIARLREHADQLQDQLELDRKHEEFWASVPVVKYT